MTELSEIQRRLREFASVAASSSPLYEHLASEAAQDVEIAGLLGARQRSDEATATLLLAAAHRLVIAEPISDLAQYYPSVGGANGVDDQVWPLFRSFVLDRADKMRALIAERVTQTNEVRRAAPVYPAVCVAAREAGGAIGLLEVGCSAGLLLGMDLYGYRYALGQSDQLIAGPVKSPLVLACALELGDGAPKPRIPKKLAIGAKVGLDSNPIDVTDEDELAWLEACVWADQPERLRRFGLAASMLRRKPPELVAGDAVADLETAAARIPEHLPLVVLSSHLLPYFDDAGQRDFLAALAELGARRPLWWVSQEPYADGLGRLLGERADPETLAVGLVRYNGSGSDGELLGKTVSLGERLAWLR